MRNGKMLQDEIENELEELGKIEIGSEQYKVTVEGLTKLIDRSIEIDKINFEMDDKIEDRETDLEVKNKQIEEDKKDRRIRNGISIAGLAIPAIITVWGTLKTLKFEEEGTVTTLAGRAHIQKMFNLFKK